MSGKVIAIFLALMTLLTAGGVYYLQVYHYYRTVAPQDAPTSIPLAGAAPAELPVTDYQGIWSVSSPLSARACFRTDPMLVQGLTPYDNPTPLIPPPWFDCFAGEAIAADLASGQVRAYLSQKNVAPKIDSVVVVYPDGRAYEWRQLNEDAEETRTID